MFPEISIFEPGETGFASAFFLFGEGGSVLFSFSTEDEGSFLLDGFFFRVCMLAGASTSNDKRSFASTRNVMEKFGCVGTNDTGANYESKVKRKLRLEFKSSMASEVDKKEAETHCRSPSNNLSAV